MNPTDEIIEFAEEKLRELYEIPLNEEVCVQLHGVYLDVYVPYVSPDTVHVSIDGLLKQIRGISKVTSYLRSKTRFVKNILKNSITCKNCTTPFFKSEMAFFERNRRSLQKAMSSKQSRVNSMLSYVNEISSRYMLNFSNLEMVISLNKLNKIFSEVKNGEGVKAALEGDYSKGVTCALERGVFIVSCYGSQIFSHDLTDFSFDYEFRVPQPVVTQYKEFRNFFDNKMPRENKKALTALSRQGTSWLKYKTSLELNDEDFGEDPCKFFKCSAENNYTDYQVNSVSLASPDVIEIYKVTDNVAQLKMAAFNQMACSYLEIFLDPVNYCIIKEIQAAKIANADDCAAVVKDDIENKKYLEMCCALDPPESSDIDSIKGKIDKMIEMGYVSGGDQRLGVNKAKAKNANRIVKLYETSYNYIQSCTAPEDESPKGQEGAEEQPAPHIPKIKPISKMSLFEIVAFLKTEDLDYTQEQINSLLALLESPAYAVPLKPFIMDFFRRYNGGSEMPLIELKYILFG